MTAERTVIKGKKGGSTRFFWKNLRLIFGFANNHLTQKALILAKTQSSLKIRLLFPIRPTKQFWHQGNPLRRI
jgi:hypothetical protein